MMQAFYSALPHEPREHAEERGVSSTKMWRGEKAQHQPRKQQRLNEYRWFWKCKYQIINSHCTTFLLFLFLYLDAGGRVRSKKLVKLNLDLAVLTTLLKTPFSKY